MGIVKAHELAMTPAWENDLMATGPVEDMEEVNKSCNMLWLRLGMSI